MSYILDALRKVEQNREQNESPNTVTFSSLSVASTRKRGIWPYLLTSALILNVSFFMAWVLFLRYPVTVSPSLASPSSRPFPLVDSPMLSKEPLKEVMKQPDQKILEHNAAEQKTVIKKRAAEKVHQSPIMGKNDDSMVVDSPPKKVTAADLPPPREMHRDRAPAAVAGKIYNFSELPIDIRSSLPEFKISGHAYGPDARTKVVRINEKILQEGQDLSTGLRLEEIIPEGLILAYQGFRFKVNLK
jgi:general secretion pathway protein B